MTTTTSAAALVLAEPMYFGQERLALAGFLAGYSGMPREAYALDLRQFTVWRHRHQLRLFRGPPGRHRVLRPRPRSRRPGRATITWRLSTIAGLYKYAVQDNLLDHSPAVHVRRPRIDYESHRAAAGGVTVKPVVGHASASARASERTASGLPAASARRPSSIYLAGGVLMMAGMACPAVRVRGDNGA